jgi:ABC-type branched-subunit amino acid transport system substrate-binding protein
MKKNYKKRIFSITHAAAISAAMLTGCGKKAEYTIKIGGIFPITSDVPALGAAMENGAELAVKEINAAGGILGKQIELVVEGDQKQASVAPNAITKLIEQDKVSAGVGTYSSKCLIPMAAVSSFSVLSYDSVYLVAEAIKKAYFNATNSKRHFSGKCLCIDCNRIYYGFSKISKNKRKKKTNCRDSIRGRTADACHGQGPHGFPKTFAA